MNFSALPKVELHLHLDCSLSYGVASRLRPGLSRAEFEKTFIAPPRCNDLADYIARAEAGVALMQSEANLRLVVEDLFDQLADDGVIYAEIRFAPLLHTREGLRPEEIVGIVNEAVGRGTAATGIEVRILLCTLRHFGADQSMDTVKLIERFRGTAVAGFDIAGDEAGYPLDAHLPAFQYAIAHGIHRTAHAGEAHGPESVRETLEACSPTRIGHGVRSIEDASLLEAIRRANIHLEVCPMSNVQTRVVPAYKDHGVDALYRRGLSLSISTDARTISNMTLGREYELLHEAFGWGPDHFRACNLHAVDAAFIPEALKRTLRARLGRGAI